MNPDQEKKIRILFITKWYPDQEDPQFGIFIKKHAQAVALYADVCVLYIAPRKPLFHLTDFYISEENTVRQYFIYYKKSPYKFINFFRNFIALKRGWRAILKNSWKPDVIHAHILPRPAVMAYYLAVKYHLPFLVSEHWVGYTNRKFLLKPFWYQWVAKTMAKKANALTVVSESLKQAMLAIGFKNNIRVIGNVVDLPALKMTPFPESEKKFILTVADLFDEQKNISGILKAIATISKTRHDFEYHIIGSGPDEVELKKLTIDAGIYNSIVFFHGKKNNEEVYTFMNKAHFVIVNSNTETFSVVTAEALASGRPVIATISGGPEEILSADSGILIEKGNQKQLEEAINKMLNSYFLYNQEKLQAIVSSRFSRQQIGKNLLSLYREIFNKKKNYEGS